ncbi:hypothetical protein ABZ760_32135 [Streptomyces sp. NPDC006658]
MQADHRLFLALTRSLVALRDATAQGRAHQPDRPAGHAAPVDGVPVVA